VSYSPELILYGSPASLAVLVVGSLMSYAGEWYYTGFATAEMGELSMRSWKRDYVVCHAKSLGIRRSWIVGEKPVEDGVS